MLFTPPCQSRRDKIIFHLVDHKSVALYEDYLADKIYEEEIESKATAYLEKLEGMDRERLEQEYCDNIGEVRLL